MGTEVEVETEEKRVSKSVKVRESLWNKFKAVAIGQGKTVEEEMENMIIDRIESEKEK